VLQGDLSIVPVLSEMLKPRIEMEGKNIYREDDVGQEMYIIITVSTHATIARGLVEA
jgi:hypothetical protein